MRHKWALRRWVCNGAKPLSAISGKKNSTPTKLRKNTTDSLLTLIDASRIATPISENNNAESASKAAPYSGLLRRLAGLLDMLGAQHWIEFIEQFAPANQ